MARPPRRTAIPQRRMADPQRRTPRSVHRMGHGARRMTNLVPFCDARWRGDAARWAAIRSRWSGARVRRACRAGRWGGAGGSHGGGGSRWGLRSAQAANRRDAGYLSKQSAPAPSHPARAERRAPPNQTRRAPSDGPYQMVPPALSALCRAEGSLASCA